MQVSEQLSSRVLEVTTTYHASANPTIARYAEYDAHHGVPSQISLPPFTAIESCVLTSVIWSARCGTSLYRGRAIGDFPRPVKAGETLVFIADIEEGFLQ